MRILLLSINYWPEPTGIGAFNTWRAEHLAKCGHEVTVCTGVPYYPEWRVPEGYRDGRITREHHNGVNVVRSRMYVPQQVTSLKRIVHEASFLATSLFQALHQTKPDLLFVVSPPLGLGLSAMLLSRRWRIPYLLDIEDLQPDAAADLGMLPRPMLPPLYTLERAAYRNASLISTLTEGMRERIVSKGISAEKVVLLPPRADEKLFGNRIRHNGIPFRRKHGLEGKFLVVHSGNMGIKQGLHIILEAAGLDSTPSNIIYLLVGDGAARPRLEQLAAERNLTNVRFFPLLEDEEFAQMLAATDLALITQQRTVSDILFPSKTVTLLTAGCPVIASVNKASEVARVISGSGAGQVVPPEDHQSLANTVRLLQGNPTQLAHMRKDGEAYARTRWSANQVLPCLERQILRAAGRGVLEPATRGPEAAPSQEDDLSLLIHK